jgi:hypothetical protein
MGNEPVSAGAFTNIFRITAIFDGIYGLAFFLAPTILFSMSQDPGFPTHPGWVRWAGGTLIGLAVGIWIASNDPVKQRPFVIALAIGHGLAALSHLYSILSGEYQGVGWFILTPAVLAAGIALAMLWLLNKYRSIL